MTAADDRDAIRSLIHGYARRIDSGDLDGVADLFSRARLVSADGQVFNLGDDHAVSLLDLVKLMIEVAGRGSYRTVPFPPERARIDIGDFYADTSKIRGALGWKPAISLRAGIEETLAFYARHRDKYL